MCSSDLPLEMKGSLNRVEMLWSNDINSSSYADENGLKTQVIVYAGRYDGINRVKIFTSNRDIRLPEGYSPENALKSAWLVLLETKDKNDRPALEVCTKDSIANAMLSMVLQGLNPVKKQCDFLVYGNKLTLQREYHGTIALAKRYADVREAVGTVIYEGDDFQYSIQPNEIGRASCRERV